MYRHLPAAFFTSIIFFRLKSQLPDVDVVVLEDVIMRGYIKLERQFQLDVEKDGELKNIIANKEVEAVEYGKSLGAGIKRILGTGRVLAGLLRYVFALAPFFFFLMGQNYLHEKKIFSNVEKLNRVCQILF